MEYTVYWKSKITGGTGNGKPMKKNIAESWIEHCNKNYPDFEHWIKVSSKNVEVARDYAKAVGMDSANTKMLEFMITHGFEAGPTEMLNDCGGNYGDMRLKYG